VRVVPFRFTGWLLFLGPLSCLLLPGCEPCEIFSTCKTTTTIVRPTTTTTSVEPTTTTTTVNHLGRIYGVVTDEAEQPLPAAHVAVYGNSYSRADTTDANGSFEFTSCHPETISSMR